MKYLFLIMTIFLLNINTCTASGVGCINYEKVIENYTFAQNSMKEFEIKSSEIKQFIVQKEEEFSKIESPLQKKKFEENVRAELKKKETDFTTFREKREEEVYSRIYAVAEKIRLEKELDVLIDSRGVFSGGIDITDALIQKLNQVR